MVNGCAVEISGFSEKFANWGDETVYTYDDVKVNALNVDDAFVQTSNRNKNDFV